jgi:hypothetical protein
MHIGLRSASEISIIIVQGYGYFLNGNFFIKEIYLDEENDVYVWVSTLLCSKRVSFHAACMILRV